MASISSYLLVLFACYALLYCALGKPYSTAYQQQTIPPITTEVAIDFDIRDLEGASLDDGALPYRLDLVDCPSAREVPGSVATYKTNVYYKNRKKGYRCSVWQKRGKYETIPIMLDCNGQALISGSYNKGLVQRISFSCPAGQVGQLTNLFFDLPPPVRLGGKAICNDYLQFIPDGRNNDRFDCEFCGNQSRIPSEAISSCWQRPFGNNISVLFRSSFRQFNGVSFGGYRFTITCTMLGQGQVLPQIDPAAASMEQTPSTNTRDCLEYSDDEEQLEASLLDSDQAIARIPVDATQTLAEYYDQLISSGMKDDSMHRLALLSQHSCDEALKSLALEILELDSED